MAGQASPPGEPEELGGLDIEELMAIKVTIVSKSEESVFRAAAPITTITGDDVRRSGATSIPDALRGAPGLFIGRGTSRDWVVASRGVTNLAGSNKFLTLIDGRTIYSPLFGGTFWSEQDVFFPDLDRIEIIRGPGATVWGANAVSGAINVITKPADQTQGLYIYGGGGTLDRAFGGARYGGRIGDAAYRVYVKGFERAGLADGPARDSPDQWWMGQGGFRLDWKPTWNDDLTVQGDVYANSGGRSFRSPVYGPPFSARVAIDEQQAGGNVLARWTHRIAGDTELTLRGYFDRVERSPGADPDPLIEYGISSYDIEGRLDASLGRRQRLGLGSGLRLVDFEVPRRTAGPVIINEDVSRLAPSYWVWGQDTIAIVPDIVRLTLGLRLERNDFSGLEAQGTGRVAVTPSERQTLWAAASRAVRVPALADHVPRFDAAVMPPATVIAFVGDTAFEAEVLWAYNLGYRIRPANDLLVDASVFLDSYTGLQGSGPGPPRPDPVHPGFNLVPFVHGNGVDGIYLGADLALSVRPMRRLGVTAFVSYVHGDLEPAPGSQVLREEIEQREGLMPAHTIGARASVDLPAGVEVDAALRVVGALAGVSVNGYAELDLRLGFRPAKSLEVSIFGQNLLHRDHVELPELIFTSEGALGAPRAVYGRVDWRW